MNEKSADTSTVKHYGQYISIPVLVLVLGCVLLYMIYGEIKREMISDLNARQMMHAKQAATGIEGFFVERIKILQNLAMNEHIAVLDETGKRMMRDLQSTHSEEISIISRIDTQGRILYAEPYDPLVIGQAVSRMENFKEAKSTNKVSVSDVFTNRRGFKSIVMHVPILGEGDFDGTLAVLLPFNLIAKLYIADIQIGKDGYAWVISKNGNEISCPVPGHVGNSVFDNCRDYPDILAMAERMIRGEQGAATYMFDRVRGDTIDKTTKHAVFMPIHFANNFWAIVVATPEDEITSGLRNFQNRLLLIAVLLITGMGAFFYMTFRARSAVRELEQRRRTEEELDRYFMESLDLLCIADTNGCFRKLNLEWERALGYALQELEGNSLVDFVHPDDREAMLTAIDNLSKQREVLNFVNRYLSKDGTYRWLEWRLYPSDNRMHAIARDITDRRCAEEELRESETKLQAIFNTVGTGILIIDSDNLSIIEANETAVKMIGLPKERIIGQICHSLICPATAGKCPVKDLGQTVDHSERKLFPADGHSKDILKTVYPFRIKGRDCYLESFIDITERKRAEEALLASEAALRSIFAAAPIGIGLVSERVLMQVNNRLCEMVGYSHEELIGKSARMLYPTEEEFEWVGREKYEQIRESGTGTVETRWKRKNGSFIDVLLSSTPLEPTDLSAGVTFTALDITERKQAEEALSESQARFRELAELLPETIFEMDTNGTLTFVNRNAFDHFGYVHEDFERGMNGFEMVSPEDRPRALANAKRVMSGVKIGLNEYKALRKDGSTFPAIMHSAPKFHDGKPSGIRGIVIDITETKKLEAQLRQAHKMEAIGTLAGGIAHDFNNILGVIIGYSEMAQADANDPIRVQESLCEVLKGANRAKDLVQQILAFSHPGEQERRPLQVGLIVKEVLKMLRASLPSTIEIKENVASRDAVVADPTQIHQVLMNLCTNSAHAMQGEPGVLQVSLTDVRLGPESIPSHSELQQGPHVKLTVKDSGHGIDPSILDRIFDPFFTTKQQGVGTGLGLSVVHGIVKGHGGAIAVESSPGEGTTFDVFFPVIETVAQPPVEGTVPLPHGRERILVVDDEPALAMVTKQMLERLGYEVDYRTNGLEALEAFRHQSKERPFDLVITDLTMPHFTGVDLAKELFILQPHLAIVLCTGFSQNMDEKNSKSLGINGFLLKPIVLKQLAAIVRKVLDERQEGSEKCLE